MRAAGAIAALAAAGMGSAAVAQTAGQAIECSMAYRAAMETFAPLTVLDQSEGIALPPVLGASTRVTFAPGNTLVFGQVPSELKLIMYEPGSPRDKVYTVSFQATFPNDSVIDNAIKASQKWHLDACGKDIPLCQRAGEPKEGPKLRYYRNDEGKPLELNCEYKLTEEDLPK